MKLTIEIPDNYYYGEECDEEGNSTVPTPPKGKRAKRERLLDRSFDEWESFRIDIAALVANHLLEMTPGYTHLRRSNKQRIIRSFASMISFSTTTSDLSTSTNPNNLQVNKEQEHYLLVALASRS